MQYFGKAGKSFIQFLTFLMIALILDSIVNNRASCRTKPKLFFLSLIGIFAGFGMLKIVGNVKYLLY